MNQKLLTLRYSLLTCLFLLIAFASKAQEVDISGDWKGTIEVPSTTLDISVELKKEGEEWKGNITIPLQKVTMPMTEIMLNGRQLTFKIPDAPGNANFDGEVSASGEKISGDFNQMGQVFPFNIVQESAAEKEKEAKRIADAIQKFRLLADSLREKRHVPGYGISIVYKDEVLVSEGFGYRDLENKIKADEETIFAIGSSSKAFTAMSLGILADDGKLGWEEPLRTYLPDFKMYDQFATQEMTALDLLTHRSGLPRHDFMWYGSNATREELYSRLRYLEPSKSFRSAWQYQNLMFMTAGYLAGKLNESTWEELVEKRIFEPLGMEQTSFALSGLKSRENTSLGYRWDGDEKELVKMEYRDLTAIGPAGSINSNAKEMAAWLKLHLNQGKVGEEKIISKVNLDKMHSPQMAMGVPGRGTEMSAPSYGMGWILYQYKGHSVSEHGGNIDGFSAQVFLMPEDEFGIVVLSNANTTPVPSLLARYAADLFLDLEETDWDKRAFGTPKKDSDEKDKKGNKEKPSKDEAKPIKGTQTSHKLSEYVGEFSHPGYGKLAITMEDKALVARFNSLEFPLAHWHYDVFNGELDIFDTGLKFTFFSNVGGDIDKVSVPLEGSLDDIVFEKLPPASLSDPQLLKKLAGTYDLNFAKAKVVPIAGDKLLLTATGQPPYELIPWRNTEFKLEGLNGYTFEFVPDKKGEYHEVILHQPNGDFRGKRIDPEE